MEQTPGVTNIVNTATRESAQELVKKMLTAKTSAVDPKLLPHFRSLELLDRELERLHGTICKKHELNEDPADEEHDAMRFRSRLLDTVDDLLKKAAPIA